MAVGQTGPGLYEGQFRPDRPGVYLVRAQAGADMVSAGLVHNPSSEASVGTVNESLLREAVRITGGSYLADGEAPALATSRTVQYVELWPPLVVALLLLFMLDVALRRWEHVQGIWEVLLAWLPGRKTA